MSVLSCPASQLPAKRINLHCIVQASPRLPESLRIARVPRSTDHSYPRLRKDLPDPCGESSSTRVAKPPHHHRDATIVGAVMQKFRLLLTLALLRRLSHRLNKQVEMLYIFAVPASQRILYGITQLANGLVKLLAKPYIELNRL